MNPIDLLFGFKGRINRAKYWLVVLIWCIVWAAVAVTMIMSGASTAAAAVALIVLISTVVSGLAIGLKRLHDRNKSGWSLLLFYLVPLVVVTWANLIDAGMFQSVLSLLGFLFLIWAFVELGCRRGSIGGNPYGPDPVAPKPAKH
ncbi:MAG: DUF805 domain-containing protein [Xanthobacteraceae bacterium]